jgi:3-oxoacyl-[acyl-carrier protein] reductase
VTGALTGRTAIITGASRGLGLAIARAFVAEGAGVVLCARDGAALEAAAETLGDAAAVETADVSRPADAERLVRTALDRFGSLEILVNNAGVYGPMGRLEDVDWDEWTRAVEINLYGSVLMCRAALPHFRAAGYGKIVQVSGGGATAPLPRLSAYAGSKAAAVRFAETLAMETKDAGIDVNAIAPGALNTTMLDEVLAAGPETVGEEFYAQAVRQREDGGTDPDLGAALAVFLASPASDGITGRLLSAVWDPWQTLSDRRAELDETDVYTLRRIVPGDRGLGWEP